MPLEVTLARSSIVAAVLVVVHVGAAACLFASGLPWWLAMAAGAAALSVLPRSLRRHAWLLGDDAVVAIGCDDRDRWWLRLGCGARLPVVPCASSVALPCASVLVFRAARRARATVVAVAPDSASRDARRRIAVALRIGAIKGRATKETPS